MTGKGSKPRPMSVTKSAFDDSFDRIFGKKQPDHESLEALHNKIDLGSYLPTRTITREDRKDFGQAFEEVALNGLTISGSSKDSLLIIPTRIITREQSAGFADHHKDGLDKPHKVAIYGPTKTITRAQATDRAIEDRKALYEKLKHNAEAWDKAIDEAVDMGIRQIATEGRIPLKPKDTKDE